MALQGMNFKKVSLFDRELFSQFQETISLVSMFLGLVAIFCTIPEKYKMWLGSGCIFLLLAWYVFLWVRANNLPEVKLKIEESAVVVKVGDLFKQKDFKAIAFNEYFDTQVDDKIIADASLNGKFIKEHLSCSVEELDNGIANYSFGQDEKSDFNEDRREGKKQKYEIGTIYVHAQEYILAALSKFNANNEAHLTMPEYLEFLIKFWDRVNRIYAQKSVSVPIFGSGITRIKGHKTIGEEDLLKIMLWTFRISEMRFKYPAKLTIIIHEGKKDRVNLFDLKRARNGL